MRDFENCMYKENVSSILKRFERDGFLQYFLKRLFLMKAVAAMKFGQMDIEDLSQEKCNEIEIKNRLKEFGYSREKIRVALKILACNVGLAKYIQFSCWKEWENIPPESVHDNAFSFAQAVIDDLQEEAFDFSYMRLYIIQLTRRMFDMLVQRKQDVDLSEISELLAQFFPKIDLQKLTLIRDIEEALFQYIRRD